MDGLTAILVVSYIQSLDQYVSCVAPYRVQMNRKQIDLGGADQSWTCGSRLGEVQGLSSSCEVVHKFKRRIDLLEAARGQKTQWANITVVAKANQYIGIAIQDLPLDPPKLHLMKIA